MTRARMSLDGNWNFLTDPRDEGERDSWFRGLPAGAGAATVSVPHIWQSDPAHLAYSGTAWYERSFLCGPEFASQSPFLVFDAVDYRARVWLNGVELGGHEGGFTPFAIDAAAALRPGENRLTVRVHDPLDNAEIPIGKQGSWYTRVSGIWQSVALEARARVHVLEALAAPRPEKGGIDLRLVLNQPPESGVRAEFLFRPHGEEKVLHRHEAEVAASSPELFIPLPGARLWSPADPFLYDLDVMIGGDLFTTYFGMRSVAVRDGMILLNGEPLYIRGALEQAFYPETVYRAPSAEYVRDEIAKAKHMGFNLLRKHIKPELPMVLYWADRLGMLVWAEPANCVKWTALARRRFADELKAMIRWDYNRPSIIAWSLYNEEWGLEWNMAGDPEKQAHVERLYAEIKALDPTRPVCDNSGWTHVKTDINDYHAYFALPDQAESFAAYHDDFMLGRPDANFVPPRRSSGEPVIVSEFGVWGLPGMEKLRRRYGGNEPWWFENRSDGGHQDDYKKPRTALANFHRFGLDAVFADFEELALHSQRRMHRAVKAIVEEMRRRRGIAGYVVTEFTDIEWETNGWLDFFRDYKAGFDRAADFNGSRAVLALLPGRNYSAGERFSADLVLLNDDAAETSGAVDWRIDAFGLEGSFAVPPGRARAANFPAAIAGEIPALSEPRAARLELSWRAADGRAVENSYELFAYPAFRANSRIAVHRLPDSFVEALRNAGWDAVPLSGAAPADILLIGALDDEASAAVRAGRKAVFLAERGDAIEEKGEWTFRALPSGESWPYAASMLYVNPALFPGLPLAKEMGWEMDGIHPRWVVPYADYQKVGGRRTVSLFGNPDRDGQGTTVSGVFQGWLRQNGGAVVRRAVGAGHLTLCTWRIMESFAAQPVAARLLAAMLAW